MSIYGFTSRCNLQPNSYPFKQRDIVRTSMFSKYDLKPTSSQNDTIMAETPERQVPHITYMENVMPVAEGVISVGYQQLVSFNNDLASTTRVIELRDDAGRRKYLLHAGSKLYVTDAKTLTLWTELTLPTELATLTGDTFISQGYVEGVTYLYASNIGAFKIALDTNAVSMVTFTALEADKILGIVATAGYLIAYSTSALYWGSVDNFLDFTPDIEVGADSQIPSDLKGNIVAVYPLPQGGLIYTDKNVVGFGATSNLRNPWLFREVPGSSGISAPEEVAYDDNMADHVVWSTSGLSQLNRLEHKLIHPEASQFLAGRLIDGALQSNGIPQEITLSAAMKVRTNIVGSRYLIISYGQSIPFQFALVYDQALRRWGKLNVAHSDVFELSSPTDSTGTATRNIAFIQPSGRVVMLNMDETYAEREGVIQIGPVAVTNEKTTRFYGATVVAGRFHSTVKLGISVSYDGTTKESIKWAYELAYGSRLSREYLLLLEGANVTLTIKGTFKLTDVLINLDGGGER